MKKILILIGLMLLITTSFNCKKEDTIDLGITKRIQGKVFYSRTDNRINIIKFENVTNDFIQVKKYCEIVGSYEYNGELIDNYLYQDSIIKLSGFIKTKTFDKLIGSLSDESSISINVINKSFRNGNTYLPNISFPSIILNGVEYVPYDFNITFGIASYGEIGRWTTYNIPTNMMCSFEACVNGVNRDIYYEINKVGDKEYISIPTFGINGLIQNKVFSTPIIVTPYETYIIAFYSTEGKTNTCSCEGIGFNLYRVDFQSNPRINSVILTMDC